MRLLLSLVVLASGLVGCARGLDFGGRPPRDGEVGRDADLLVDASVRDDAGDGGPSGGPDAGDAAARLDAPTDAPGDAAVERADGGPAPCEIPTSVVLGPPLVTITPYYSTTFWTGASWLHVQTESPRVIASAISRDGIRSPALELGTWFVAPLRGVIGITGAWTGERALVAWVEWDDRAPFRIWVARVGADGAREAEPIEALATPGGYWVASVWTGDQLGIAHSGAGIRMVRVDEEGARIGEPTEILGSASTSPPAIAWNGDEYAVAWMDTSSGVSIARVGADGVAQAPQNVLPRREYAATEAPLIFASGREWIVTARSDPAIRVLRLSAAGEVVSSFDVVLRSPVRVAADDQRNYAVAQEPFGYSIAYTQSDAEESRLALLRVDDEGRELEPELAVTSTVEVGGEAYGPDLVRSDVELAATWTGVSGASHRVRRLRAICR
jgi:hypothetical protein